MSVTQDGGEPKRDRDRKRRRHMHPRLPPPGRLEPLPAALGGRVVSERDSWSPVSGPCPSQRPAGSPPPVPRVPQPASGSAPPGPTLAFWKRKREGSRGRLQGAGCLQGPGSWAGEAGRPGVPAETRLWKGRQLPKSGCAHAPPAAFRPPLPVPPAPKPLRWQLPGAQPLGPTAGPDPAGVSPRLGL